MSRFKTLIIFLLLTAIWSAFFSTVKFFLWGELSNTLQPNLQTISGYLSLGGVFAYLVGGAIAYTFLKKYVLFVVSTLSLLFVYYAYNVGFNSEFSLAIVLSFLGILYGLWSVVKNILISVEIKKTGLPDTTVNALVGIAFVIFIIFGSILGSILFEKLGHNGYYVIMGMLTVTSILSLFLNYDQISLQHLLKNGIKVYYYERKGKFINSMKDYIPDVKYILKKYYKVILTSSLIWSISTIVSQQAVEYSVNNFGKDPSGAAFVLLFSAVGVIIGNIISVKMDTNRWKYFKIFNILFAIFVFSLPFASINFSYISAIAFIIGVFFGIASNLIDAYFFRKIGEENKKEYGSSTYGLILSLVIFIMMFFSSAISNHFSYTVLMIILGSIVLVLSFISFQNN
ncbi:MAG: MFS transporter [Candidatus Gracilibacteria bacterium]|nr:MFS transporter [Candidatus Gracilibacteria bacterium]